MREEKNVFVGEVHHKHLGNNEKRNVVPVIFKVTERMEDTDGNRLLIPKLTLTPRSRRCYRFIP